MATISEYQKVLNEQESYKDELNGYLSDSNYSNSHDLIKTDLENINSNISSIQKNISSQVLSKASVINYEIPNRKDKGEWYAGGTLRNESYPGGAAYSPTSIPSFDNKIGSSDIAGMLLSGSFAFLNGGFNTVNYLVQGGLLDLLSEDSVNKVQVYTYTITITNTTTGRILATRSGSTNSGDISQGIETQGSFSTAETKSMFENRYAFNMNPINVAVTIHSLMTGEDMSFSQAVGAGLMGTAMQTFSSALSKGVASALGITSTIGSLAVGSIVSSIMGEIAEVALGLDQSFGFGGERVGKNTYEASQSIGQFAENTFAKAMIGMGISGYSTFTQLDTVSFENGQYTNYGAVSYESQGYDDSLGNWEQSVSAIDGSFSYSDDIGSISYNAAAGDTTRSFGGSVSIENAYGDVTSFSKNYSANEAMSMTQHGGSYGGGIGGDGIDGGTFSGYSGMGSFDADSASVGLGSSDDASSSFGGGDDGGGGSYIATATTQELGKGGLSLFVKWRKHMMKTLPTFKITFGRYMATAPKIVKVINSKPNRKEIYTYIYDNHLEIIYKLIKKDFNDKDALDLYIEMVKELKKEYL